MPRTSSITRQTNETQLKVEINLDGTGIARIHTGIGFFDHMLNLLARHSLIDLTIEAKGDLQVDPHHTVEDTGISLGKAVCQALGDKAGIRRYGHCILPMDETLVTVAVDFSGRPYLVWKAEIPSVKLGDFDAELAEDFWQGFVTQAQCNFHIILHDGRNTHHKIEAIFKAAARAIRQAVEPDPRLPDVIPSTKGTLSA